jgi:hypothetical protein
MWRRSRSPLPTAVLLAGALALAGCGSSSSSSSSSSASSSSTPAASTTTTGSRAGATLGFEGVALEQGGDLAPAGTTQTGTVDGIQCGATEQLAYHIHAHLSVFVGGAPKAIPPGVGIPGSAPESTPEGPIAAGGQCIYWLHTHTSDGVIHIESPTQRIYTLGNFFDVWHQPLSANQVGTATGKVTAYVDGRPWTKDPRAIPLNSHTVIQLSVGSPVVPFQTMSWAATQL